MAPRALATAAAAPSPRRGGKGSVALLLALSVAVLGCTSGARSPRADEDVQIRHLAGTDWIVLQWQTATAHAGRVEILPGGGGPARSAIERQPGTKHDLLIPDLAPDTSYEVAVLLPDGRRASLTARTLPEPAILAGDVEVRYESLEALTLSFRTDRAVPSALRMIRNGRPVTLAAAPTPTLLHRATVAPVGAHEILREVSVVLAPDGAAAEHRVGDLPGPGALADRLAARIGDLRPYEVAAALYPHLKAKRWSEAEDLLREVRSRPAFDAMAEFAPLADAFFSAERSDLSSAQIRLYKALQDLQAIDAVHEACARPCPLQASRLHAPFVHVAVHDSWDGGSLVLSAFDRPIILIPRKEEEAAFSETLVGAFLTDYWLPELPREPFVQFKIPIPRVAFSHARRAFLGICIIHLDPLSCLRVTVNDELTLAYRTTHATYPGMAANPEILKRLLQEKRLAPLARTLVANFPSRFLRAGDNVVRIRALGTGPLPGDSFGPHLLAVRFAME